MTKSGRELLNDPILNRETAFSFEDRDQLGLRGLRQLEQLKERLTSKRQELAESIDNLKEIVESGQNCDDLNSGDSASFNEAHHGAVTMSNQNSEIMSEIDAALNRLKEGRYGKDESTGDAISFQRLLIVPWAGTGADN